MASELTARLRSALRELNNVPWNRLYGIEGPVDDDELAGLLKTAWKAQRYVRTDLEAALAELEVSDA